jgi:hypothetical protein
MKYILPFFGEINTTPLTANLRTNINFANNEVRIDINAEENNIDISRLDLVHFYLDNLQNIHEQNIVAIHKDFNNGAEAKYYVDELFDIFDEDDLQKLLVATDKTRDISEQILSMLFLSGIVFYVDDNADNFVVFEYTINKEMLDNLLVLKYNDKKTLNGIYVES